jgi:hypothetical protein
MVGILEEDLGLVLGRGFMARLPLVFESQVSPAMKLAYRRAVQPDFGLTATYQALFTSPGIASQLANLDAQLRDQVSLEPWVRFTVALTVAHERDNQVLWRALWDTRLPIIDGTYLPSI